MLPRLKPLYPLCRVGEAVLRLGAEVGVTCEVDDETGAVERFIRSLDGSHDRNALAHQHRLSTAEVEEAISVLDQERFLEGVPVQPESLDTEERTRYQANTCFTLLRSPGER